MALHLASVWNSGLEQLGNGLLKINPLPPTKKKNQNATVFPITTGKEN